MCRMIVFGGSCTRCGDICTWSDLTQQLSCLEAKNKGAFGECKGGVHMEEHSFDQECPECSEEDEGIGDLEVDEFFQQGNSTLVPESLRKRSASDAHEDGYADRKKQKT